MNFSLPSRGRTPLCILLSLWLAASIQSRPAQAPQSGTVSFVLEGNRTYARVAFVRPDGALRQTLVFVDMGSPSVAMSEELFTELGVGAKQPLTIRLGDLAVAVDSSSVEKTSWFPFSISEGRKVEALLPAGILQKYQVVLDYGQRTLTLAQPGTLKPEGDPIPLRVNEKTGLAVVDASINGRSYPMTIDNGSAYTWLRKSAAQGWLSAHPDWQRGVGAVGLSNMRMADDGVEAAGLLIRLPELTLGSVRFQQLGALAIGPSERPDHFDMIDWYSRKNPVSVIGWLGGNALRSFRITIDYPNRVSYWLRQGQPDPHELDQVGLTLQFRNGEYLVAGVATKNGHPTVDGIQSGDKLLQIDSFHTASAGWAAIFVALHGKPGDVRTLVLERNGKSLQVQATVTGF